MAAVSSFFSVRYILKTRPMIIRLVSALVEFRYRVIYVNKYSLLINMTPHVRELTLEQREIINQLSNEVYSSHKIQDLIGINSIQEPI